MKPPNIVTVHFLSAKWSKKLFTINHYELQNGKCIVTQELSAYDTSKLEKLNRELEKSEKKLRKAINDEKALQHQLKQLTRKERTHRLCTRGGMLESFLQEPERLTDDDVMLLLKLIFHRQETQDILKKLLEREKSETP